MQITNWDFLLILIVVIPLLCSVVLVFIPNWKIAWTVNLLVAIFIILSTALFLTKIPFDTLYYNIGNFNPPFGINYKLDYLALFFITILAIVNLLSTLFSAYDKSINLNQNKLHLFYTLFLLHTAGIFGIILTNDIFNLFVFLEISSLASYILITLSLKDHGAFAAFNHLLISTIAATLYVFGVAILYLMFGTLNMDDLVLKIVDAEFNPLFLVAIIIICVYIIFKLSLFPLFNWLPAINANGNQSIIAFLIASSSSVGIYILIRFLFTIIGRGKNVVLMPILDMFNLLALLTIIVTSLIAIKQNDLKKLLSYSAIGQVAYIILGITAFNTYGLQSSLYLIFNDSLLKFGIFAIFAIWYNHYKVQHLNKLTGVAKEYKGLYIILAYFLLSVVGIPATPVFWGKLQLLIALLHSSHIISFVIVLIGSLLSLIYVIKILYYLYFNTDGNHIVSAPKIPLKQSKLVTTYHYLPIVIVLCLSVLITIFPSIIYDFVNIIITTNIITNKG